QNQSRERERAAETQPLIHARGSENGTQLLFLTTKELRPPFRCFSCRRTGVTSIMIPTTRGVLAVFLSLTAAQPLWASSQAGDAGRLPNVVFIMADDLGWTDVGCQGSRFYETPHIDKLAAKGLRLTSHYHSPNCAPTRAALMTGQYAPRTGVYTVGSLERGMAEQRKMNVPQNVTDLPLDRQTLGDLMKGAGYTT